MVQPGTERGTGEHRAGQPRRTLLRAVAAGGALAATRAVGSASGRTEGDVAGARQDGEGREGSVHEVRTLISGPPTNEGRPADFFYQPTGLHVQPGDVVRFVFETPDHNVVSYHPAFGMRRRVPVGVEPIASPLLGWDPASIPDDQIEPPAEGRAGGSEEGSRPRPSEWLLSPRLPGVYDLLCSPHESFGMAMRLVVGDETSADFETSKSDALPEPRAGPVGLARLTLTDPALAPERIVERGRVRWQALEANRRSTETGSPGSD